jgi:hypothetical protein
LISTLPLHTAHVITFFVIVADIKDSFQRPPPPPFASLDMAFADG